MVKRTIGIGAAALAAMLAAAAATATDSPYAGEQRRAIKALAEEEINELLAGHGMGLSMAAELNHYPGPRHALDLGDKIGLTADQRRAAEQLIADVRRDAGALGREIVADEEALDAMFVAGGAELGAVDAMVARIAERRGRLRFIHLAAHVKMRALLTPHQIALYDGLRGYGDGAGHEHHKP